MPEGIDLGWGEGGGARQGFPHEYGSQPLDSRQHRRGAWDDV